MRATIPVVDSPEGQALPFIAGRAHSVAGEKVLQPMLFPSRELLAEGIAQVPPGASSDLIAVRAGLADEYGAASTCPVTTQRLLQEIAADAVAAWQAGEAATPFWRVVDPERPNTRRLPGGAEFVAARQAEERR